MSIDAAGSGGCFSRWLSFIHAEKASHWSGSCQPKGSPSGGKKSGSVTPRRPLQLGVQVRVRLEQALDGRVGILAKVARPA